MQLKAGMRVCYSLRLREALAYFLDRRTANPVDLALGFASQVHYEGLYRAPSIAVLQPSRHVRVYIQVYLESPGRLALWPALAPGDAFDGNGIEHVRHFASADAIAVADADADACAGADADADTGADAEADAGAGARC